MLLPAFTTVIYLISWCSSITTFPTPGTNFRDSIFGLEQTTRRSRQTTTIDYDLADFDEFGNDPGMYDVAGSPDTVNLVDDNDQGYDYQPGFDTGQTLFGPMYTVSPGVSKYPINSGGISDEVRVNAVNRQEGGPSDEGVFTNTNQEQSVKDMQVVNSNYRTTDADEYNNQDTDADEYNNQIADPDNQQDARGNSKKSANKILSTGETQAKGTSSKNQKEAPIPTEPSEKDKIKINNIQVSKNSLTEKEGNSLNEESGTRTRTGTLEESKSKKKTSGTNQFREKSFATQDFSTNGKDDGTNTASTGSKEPTWSFKDSSGGHTGSGGSRESSNEFGSYTVYDSNSQEFSRSQSNERMGAQYSGTEEASSVEILSAEDITREKQNQKEAARDKSNSIDSTDIGSDSLGSQSPSSENRQQSSIEENKSSSSSEKYSSLTSDEYGSQSTSDENNSEQSSDEAGLRSSSDENIPDSTSDESRSQPDSDGNMQKSSSDENNSNSSEKRDSQPFSAESTDKTLAGNGNDIDYDNDLDNDYDNDTSSTGYEVNTSFQASVDGEFSEGEEKSAQKDTSLSAETISYTTEGSGSAGTSPKSDNDLSGCFVSTNEDGKYCYLLRSLYNICKMQFKQECISDLGQQSMIDKVSSDSKSLNPGSVSDTSSESADDPFSDSLESSASSGSFSSSSSKPESMSLESVENLSASFEKTNGIFEVISLIRDACQSICALAEGHDENKPDQSSTGNDVDVDSSESSDEDDWIEISNEAWIDSDEDQDGTSSFALDTVSESSTNTNDLTQEEDASGTNSGEYSVERHSNEQSDDVSYASLTSTESTNSAGSSSLEYDSRPSENTSD